MAEHIELPGAYGGKTDTALRDVYNYLYKTAQTLNVNFNQIGDSALTDEEQALMNRITRATQQGEAGTKQGYSHHEQETLKSLIIKTATFVKNEVDNYRLVLFGESEADSEFGSYTQRKGCKVDVTPNGVQQTYSFNEIVRGLKTYEINAKNYIKTGYLRTENSIPIYGVAIGRDVVTFAEDGTETYNDGNKVAELTADALTFFNNSHMVARYKDDGLEFYQGGVLVAKYTGSRISFYQNGSEVMYIQNGKIYSAGDMEIGSGKKIKIANWEYTDDGLIYYYADDASFAIGPGISALLIPTMKSGLKLENGSMGITVLCGSHQFCMGYRSSGGSGTTPVPIFFYDGSNVSYLGHDNKRWGVGYIDIVYSKEVQPSLNDTGQKIGSNGCPWPKGYFDTIYYNSIGTTSSREVKHNIRDMAETGDRIDRLRPVTFIYDNDPDERKRAGLIYEEAAEVMPEICIGDESEKAVNYVELIPFLLKEIQSLRARVKELEDR